MPTEAEELPRGLSVKRHCPCGCSLDKHQSTMVSRGPGSPTNNVKFWKLYRSDVTHLKQESAFPKLFFRPVSIRNILQIPLLVQHTALIPISYKTEQNTKTRHTFFFFARVDIKSNTLKGYPTFVLSVTGDSQYPYLSGMFEGVWSISLFGYLKPKCCNQFRFLGTVAGMGPGMTPPLSSLCLSAG